MRSNLLKSMAAAAIAVMWAATLSAQQNPDEKKVIVTIRNTESDGSEVTRTIIKRGKAAEDFDTKQYIYENTRDKRDAVVLIGDDAENALETPLAEKKDCSQTCHSKAYSNHYRPDDFLNRGYLGVTDPEARGIEKGVKVNVSPNLAAHEAGLKSGDIITDLNGTPVNSFDELAGFLAKTKSGDPLKINYLRDGQAATATATLGKVSDQWKHKWVEEQKAACLGTYSSVNNERTDIGPKVTGFTAQSAAREAEIQTGDFITAINGATVVTHKELWDEIAKYKPEDRVNVAFTRDGKQKQVEVTLKACENQKGKEKSKEKIKNKAPQSAERGGVPDYERRLYVTAFTAYPNPAQDFVNVEFTADAGPLSVSLLDLTGKVLYTKNYDSFNGNFQERFDLSTYPKGNIIIQLLQGDKVYTHQIAVQ